MISHCGISLTYAYSPFTYCQTIYIQFIIEDKAEIYLSRPVFTAFCNTACVNAKGMSVSKVAPAGQLWKLAFIANFVGHENNI